jgi:hypothetical protein
MTRFTNSENQTGAAQSHVFMLVMVHLDFGTAGDLYLHDGQGTFSWNSVDWLGAGDFGSISVIAEAQDDRPKPLKLTLSGIDSGIMTEAMAANYYGRSCKIYVGFFDEDNALLASPELEYEGRMDSMRILAAKGSASVELTCESRLILWSRSNGSLYTDEDQQDKFSGDKFFNQQCTQADQYLEWGVLTSSGISGSAGGIGGSNEGGVDVPPKLKD